MFQSNDAKLSSATQGLDAMKLDSERFGPISNDVDVESKSHKKCVITEFTFSLNFRIVRISYFLVPNC